MDNETLLALTSDIVSAHVSNNTVAGDDLARVIRSVYEALSQAGQSEVVEDKPLEPAVSVRSSVKPDYIICLEDGKKLKMLKRHLMTHYSLTPDQYRQRWNLPADYPMVAPNYAAKRRELAKKIGLGRKPGETRKAIAARKPAALSKAAAPSKAQPAKSRTSKPRTAKPAPAGA